MTKFTNIRMPIDLYNEIKKLAEAESRSVSSQIVHLLRQAVTK